MQVMSKHGECLLAIDGEIALENEYWETCQSFCDALISKYRRRMTNRIVERQRLPNVPIGLNCWRLLAA